MYGTAPNSPADIAQRKADAIPRFPLPACDIETGAENTVEATIILDEFETCFGVCQALVTIEGRPEDWSITSIEVPTDIMAFSRYCAAKSPRWFREDWSTVCEGGSFVEREISRAVREAISEDTATDALREAL